MQLHFLKTIKGWVLAGAFLAAAVAQATGFSLVLSESRLDQPVTVHAVGAVGKTSTRMEEGDALPIAARTVYFFEFEEEVDAGCPVLEARFELRRGEAEVVSRFRYCWEAGSAPGKIARDVEGLAGYQAFQAMSFQAGTCLVWMPVNGFFHQLAQLAAPEPADNETDEKEVPAAPAEERKQPMGPA